LFGVQHQGRGKVKKSLFLAGVLAACVAHSQVVTYKFDVFFSGVGAQGPTLGAFNYQQGAITDASFSGGVGALSGPYAGKLTDGNTELTFTQPGETLTGQLTSPLLGQTDTFKGGLLLTFSAGGSEGFCGGSGFCNAPIVLTATGVQKAPELNTDGALTSFLLLVGSVLVLRGRRSAAKVELDPPVP
jgi:hypothetical protein